MNFVEPIRSKETLNGILKYLRATNERDYLLFLVGCHSALRISDILKLKVSDAYDQKIYVSEKKTGKYRLIKLNSKVKKALLEYAQGKDPDDYLFKSREKYNRPISRQRAWQIINNTCAKFGVENVGTHTLRKTFGYFFYTQYNDIDTLMKILNHNTSSYTARYIGIEQEKIDDMTSDFCLF